MRHRNVHTMVWKTLRRSAFFGANQYGVSYMPLETLYNSNEKFQIFVPFSHSISKESPYSVLSLETTDISYVPYLQGLGERKVIRDLKNYKV